MDHEAVTRCLATGDPNIVVADDIDTEQRGRGRDTAGRDIERAPVVAVEVFAAKPTAHTFVSLVASMSDMLFSVNTGLCQPKYLHASNPGPQRRHDSAPVP
jgi:hypothetical protein